MKFWDIYTEENGEGVMTLYGEVCERTPTDWFTGEKLEGDFITPEGFREDLAAAEGCKNLTVKINSGGGDLYTGIAIYNALKELDAHKTVVVEGLAASAASVIAMAGDEIQVYTGSTMMIHNARTAVIDYVSRSDAEKIVSGLEAADKAIANIYAEKTGLDVDHIRELMDAETWMVGQEAVDEGFADALIDGSGAQVTYNDEVGSVFFGGIGYGVENHRGAYRVAAKFGAVPIEVLEKLEPQQAPEDKKSEPEAAVGQTVADRKPAEGALTDDIIARVRAEAAEEAAKAERARLAAIDEIAPKIADRELVHRAKYGDEPMTAEQLAYEAIKQATDAGSSFLAGVYSDAAGSGAVEVTASPVAADITEPDDTGADLAAILNAAKKKGEQKNG